MRRIFRTKKTLFGVSAAAAVVAGLAAAGGALAAGQADEAPTETNGGSIVEDFSYPGAAQILAERHVKLISGDGHIMLADCATPPQGDIGVMKVYTTDPGIGGDPVCFKVTAPTGWLTLEVPAVYEIRGDGRAGSGQGHEVTAELRNDAGLKTVECDPDGSTQVGITADPPESPTTLLKLTATGLAG